MYLTRRIVFFVFFTMTIVLGNSQTITLVKDIYELATGSIPVDFASLGNKDIFRATLSNEIGSELFITDGTFAGTDTIRNINPFSVGSSDPSGMITYNNLVWFGAYDGIPPGPGSTGFELWKSDGTRAGTTIFLDIFSGNGSSDPSEFGVLGSNMLFDADDGTNGKELWITDGNVAGTSMLVDINSTGSSNPSKFTLVGTELYFVADDGTNGTELWKTDGTVGGTVMVSNIDGAVTSSNPHDLTEFGGEVFFSADDGSNGRELWKSDGTLTTMVIDLNNSGDGLVNLLGDEPTIATHNGELFFGGSTSGIADMELWKTDGTSGGTTMVFDINPTGTSLPGGLTNIGTDLIFAATNASGREMWKSKGLSSNTTMVFDLVTGSSGSFPQQFHFNSNSNEVYFRAENDEPIGAELFKFGPIILPIELTIFTAEKQNNNALLKWQTASEQDNDRFEVERSTNGFDFEKIGTINGTGNSAQTIDYSFIDDEPNEGINYYRLKQIDFDSGFEYSDIRQVHFVFNEEFEVYPNPFRNTLHFNIAELSQEVHVQIHDLFGRIILNKMFASAEEQTIYLDNLLSGTYIITVSNSKQSWTQKVIKQ